MLNRLLLPVLTQDSMKVSVTLDSENRQDYGTLRYLVFSIQDYVRYLLTVNGPTQNELRRNLGSHGRRHLNLNSKWIESCTTGKEITELVSIDEIDAL